MTGGRFADRAAARSPPFIRTIAINELGRLKAAKAVPGLLIAARDKEPLVRSATLQALAQIGRQQTPRFPRDHRGDDRRVGRRGTRRTGGQAVGPRRTRRARRQSDHQRQDVMATLVGVLKDPNPRLASKAREIVSTVYQATPEEIEKLQRATVK